MVELTLRIKDMVVLGILTERSRPNDPPRVYAVALNFICMIENGSRKRTEVTNIWADETLPPV